MGLPLEKLPEPAWSDVWSIVRDRLRIEFGQGIFDTWIAPLSFAGADDGHVRLSAPRRLIRDYVATHHAARMERAFAAASQGFVGLDIIAAAMEPRAAASKATLGTPPTSATSTRKRRCRSACNPKAARQAQAKTRR